MNTTYLLGIAGIIFCVGVITGWVIAGDSQVTSEIVSTVTDTLIIRDTIIETVTDTIKSKPIEIVRSRIVRDTIRDTLYAEAVRYNEYSAEKTFQDSAWIRHTFGIEKESWLLGYNKWDYRKPPQKIIVRLDSVKVYPSKTEKIIKGAMWMAAGGGLTAMIANNTK